MPRWEGDGRSRLEEAALDLFLERGYDGTSVANIAARAGLTERSFYRHFADKREVLFASGDVLTTYLVDRLRKVPAGKAPLAALLEAMAGAEEIFLSREQGRRRAEAIERSAALSERELIKLAGLANAMTRVLIDRGADENDAALATDLGMSAFKLASQNRLRSETSFQELLAAAVERQSAVFAQSRS